MIPEIWIVRDRELRLKESIRRKERRKIYGGMDFNF